MAICTRCQRDFANEHRLKQHWKTLIPCDYICNKCGNKLTSHSSFKMHIDTDCKYLPKYSKNNKKKQLDLVEKQEVIDNSTKKTVNHINTQTNYNNTTNNINIHINNLFINPHTHEMKIDKEQLLGDIVEKILFRMDTGLSGKANWGTIAFTDSFHQMFTHIYGNKQRPENQNLLLKDETTRELQIFNGEEFVDDKLTSEERMLKVLHFIGDGLRWMVENCDNYTEEEKEQKSDKIGRVLSGIPRFKMTYKAMFDNIFNTLKDVREQIIERSKEIEKIEN